MWKWERRCYLELRILSAYVRACIPEDQGQLVFHSDRRTILSFGQRNILFWFKYQSFGDNIHTSVYYKRDDFGFPKVNFPWLNSDVSRLPSYGIYISLLVWFARCCTSVFDLFKKSSNHFNTFDKGLQISQASENAWEVFQVILCTFSKFVAISLQEYVSQGITHPVFYGDLVYKLRRVKGEANFIWLGS